MCDYMCDDSPIDRETMALFTGNDKAQQDILLSVFFATMQKYMTTLAGHLEGTKSATDWGIAAHSMKGASAQIGAHRLSTLCRRAETGADSIGTDEKHALFIALQQEITVLEHFFHTDNDKPQP